MAQNIPAQILGMMAGVAVSMTSGALLGAYVVTGVAPADAGAPPRVRPEPALFDADTWPAPDYLAPVSGSDDDQAAGVLASGSSRL